MKLQDRILVALDVDDLETAAPIVDRLIPHVGYFKIGLELITAIGAPAAVEWIHQKGGKVFLDGKFCDIPNTVAAASRAASEILNAEIFNVHASCGFQSMHEAVANKGDSKLLAVTVLTSFSPEHATEIFGKSPTEKVVEYAELAMKAGVDGIICSPQELPLLKHLKKGTWFVTPGVRPQWAATQDQKRVMTPKEALENGATHLVIGRPILKPPKEIGGPVEAVKRILEEMETAKI